MSIPPESPISFTAFSSVKGVSAPVTVPNLSALLAELVNGEPSVFDEASLPSATDPTSEREREVQYAAFKDRSRAWSPASAFDGLRGGLPNAEASVVVYDFDKMTPEQTARVKAWAEGFESAGHTSFSHRHASKGSLDAWRVLIRLARPVVGPAAYKATWVKVAEPLRDLFTPGPLDVTSAQLSRKYFYGVALSSTLDERDWFLSESTVRPEPETVDPSAPVSSLTSSTSPRPATPETPVDPTVLAAVLAAAEAVAEFLEPYLPAHSGQRHTLRLALAGVCAKYGWPLSAASEIVYAADPSKDLNDTPATVRTTYARFETVGNAVGLPTILALLPATLPTTPTPAPLRRLFDLLTARPVRARASAPALSAAASAPASAPTPGPRLAPLPAADRVRVPPATGPRPVAATASAAAPDAAPAPDLSELGDFLASVEPVDFSPSAESLVGERPQSEWDVDAKGKLRNTQRNLITAISHEYDCWFDTLKSVEHVSHRPTGMIGVRLADFNWKDTLDRLATKYSITGPTTKELYAATQQVCHRNSIDPLQTFLHQLPVFNPDGDEVPVLPRVVRALARNSPDPRRARRAATRWLIGTYLRGLRPGAHHPVVLVLHGREGTGKSSWLRAIANGNSQDQFYTSAATGVSSVNVQIASSEYWISEWEEGEILRASAYPAVKAFLVQTEDRFRRPYDIAAITKPRRTSIALTLNDLQVLPADETESRRFRVMMDAEFPELQWMRDNRERLWSEVAWLVGLGLDHALDPRDERQERDAAAQEMRHSLEGLEEVEEVLSKIPHRPVKALEVFEKAHLLGYGSVVRNVHFVNRALKLLGYYKNTAKKWELPKPIDGASPPRPALAPERLAPEVFFQEDEIPAERNDNRIVTSFDNHYRIAIPPRFERT